MSTKTLGYDSSPLQEGKFGNTWRPLCLWALKMTVILDLRGQIWVGPSEGNSIRIRVLGLLVTTAHVRILPSDNDSLSEGKIFPSYIGN